MVIDKLNSIGIHVYVILCNNNNVDIKLNAHKFVLLKNRATYTLNTYTSANVVFLAHCLLDSYDICFSFQYSLTAETSILNLKILFVCPYYRTVSISISRMRYLSAINHSKPISGRSYISLPLNNLGLPYPKLFKVHTQSKVP